MPFNRHAIVKEPFLPIDESDRWPNIPAPENIKETIVKSKKIKNKKEIIKVALNS